MTEQLSINRGATGEVEHRLTQAFSPELVRDQTKAIVLRMVLHRVDFQVRILTKNAIAGSKRHIRRLRERS